MNSSKIIALIFVSVLGNTIAYSQVNLQTGSATFSLPMFNWQDHKSSLTTTIGLSYNSGSGLKVNDVASEVGQGWSLLAGGVITRMQVGEPDDQVQHGKELSVKGHYEKYLKKYPNGYLYADKEAYDGCPTALTKYPLYKAKNQLYKQYNEVTEDKQLDYFSFQFNGKAGLFVLNASPNSPVDPTQEDVGLPLGDTKLKIKFQRNEALTGQGKRNTITSFTIQDVDGLIYKFSKHGLTKLLESKYCDRYGNYEHTQPAFKKGEVYYQNDFESNTLHNPYIISSWYLTEIKDPLTLRVITLNYPHEETINAYAGADFSYNHNSHYSTVSYKRSISTKPRLGSIVYPDGHTVTLHYDKSRIDFNGSSALTAVDIKYSSRFLSKYLINTTYFILNRYGTPVTDYQKSVARLCLKSVQKIGPDLKEDSPPYIFDYYTGSDTEGDFVPPPFYFKKDVWGYYNSDKSVNTHWGANLPNSVVDLKNDDIIGLCYLREVAGSNNTYTSDLLNVKPDYAKNGLLKQIVYPTGGTLTYEYKQNTGYLNDQLQQVGGVHVFQTSSTDGGYSNGCDNPIKTSYNYVLNQTGSSSSLWGLEMPVNHMAMSSYYEPKDKKYKWPIISGSLVGKCTYDFLFPGILSIQQATNLSGVQQFMEAFSPVMGVVGSVSTVLNAIKVFTASSGVLAIVSLVIDVVVGVYTLIKTCFGNHIKDVTTRLYYNYDLNSVNPLPTQFKRVEVVESPGTIGKTVHDFTSDADYKIRVQSNPFLTSGQRFATWAYGLPKSTSVLKANGDTVKATFYSYDTTYAWQLMKAYDPKHGGNASKLNSNLISCKCQVLKTFSQKSTDYNNPTVYNGNYLLPPGNSDMAVEMHGFYTGRVNLREVREKVFNESSPTVYTETITNYTYNGGYNNYSYTYLENYEVKTIATTKSNGDVVTKYIEYSATASNLSDPVITKLNENNIVALPIRTTTYIQKAGSSTQEYISDSRTEFAQVGGGAIKPLRQFEKRFAQPTTDPGTIAYTEVKTFNYDGAGNLVKVKDEGGRVVSNWYDHDDKYVTATIINSDAAADKVAYTSFETANFGGWSLSGTSTFPTTSKVTGSRSLELSSGVNSLTASSLNQSVSYRLSFWATAPLSVSGGGTLMVSAPVISGFTYYEYEFPTGVTSITISGSALIDELRLYPKAARMSTVSYDPLIGKTSECDANNRITYYEYDDLGRMRFIKDEKRNIVKMYEYNNVSKQNGCPVTYYSRYTKEVFKRNCGSGYLSRPYIYSIPAGKYTSTISQEDADAKVQSELLTQGQAAAEANAVCVPVNCNDAQSTVVYSEDCLPGYKAGGITYSVPAGRYCDTLSKDSVNKLALEEIEANAQAYANDPANMVCVIDYDPHWEAGESAPTECRLVNGQNYLFARATDVNPNSTTYGSTQWLNTGQYGGCTLIYYEIQFTNSSTDRHDVILTNIVTNEESKPSMYPTSSGLLAKVPGGKYNIQITNKTSTANRDYSICDMYFANGNSVTISNVEFGPGCKTVTVK